MNDNEKYLFRKAFGLKETEEVASENRLPAELTAKVMERIARERAMQELRADRAWNIAAIVFSCVCLASLLGVILHFGWLRPSEIWLPIRNAFASHRMPLGEFDLQSHSTLLIISFVMLFYGSIILWIDARRKRKAL